MCLVHRILKSCPATGRALDLVSYEEPVRTLARPRNAEIFTLTVSAPSTPLVKRLQKEESKRLTGMSFEMPRIEQHRLSPQNSTGREKIATTREQRDHRMFRNRHKRTLGRYEHVEPAHTFMWHGEEVTIPEERTVRKITKSSWAQSAGKHGRKPRYKDHRSMQAHNIHNY